MNLNLLWYKRAAIGIIAFIVILLSWEFFSQFHAEVRFVLPAPSKVIITLWERSDRLAMHTFVTFKEMVGGFLIALSIAFPLAWMMALFKSLRAIFQPAFVAIQCIPVFALAPLMVLWFGWSYVAIIAATALMIFFPLTMSIYQGLCSTPKHLIDFFKTHQATAWQTFFKLQLPWALPHIFSGFRIAVAIAGIGAVAGEWAGAQEGLGLLMLESRRASDIEMMFAALTCVTALSLSLYGCAVFLEGITEQRPKISKSHVKVVVIFLLGSLCLMGCGKSKTSDNKTILMLDWLPNPNHVAIYAGIDRGFFQEQGINLSILKVADPSDGIPYLLSEQIDISLAYMPHTIQAMSHGAKVKTIGILIQEPLNALIYRTGEGIEKISDLTNKVIGYCVDGYSTHFLRSMLSNKDVSPRDFRNVSFDLVAMLGSGQVDALYGAYWNIECENLRRLGVDTDYFPLTDFGVPTYYELIFLAKEGGEQATEQFAKSFKVAMQNSIDFSKKNPQEAFALYLKSNPDKSLKTREWEMVAWEKTLPVLADSQDIDPNIWENFVSYLVKHKLMP